jgi:hypothetical protein
VKRTERGYELDAGGAPAASPGTAGAADATAAAAAAALLAGPVAGANAGSTRATGLAEFLASLRLEGHAPGLRALGVDGINDLDEATDEDLAGVGMKPLHVRRVREAAARWKAAVGGPTPAAAGVVRASPPRRAASPAPATRAPGNSSALGQSGDAAAAEAAAAAAASGVPRSCEWEEYATSDGFLYYHNVSD